MVVYFLPSPFKEILQISLNLPIIPVIPITKNNYPKGEEIPGLTPGLAHAVMFFTNIHLRPVSDTTILVG